MHKSITNALNKSTPAAVIYDDHYLEVIREFRVAVEQDGVSVSIALANATTSGIGVNQIADLHRVAAERYPG